MALDACRCLGYAVGAGKSTTRYLQHLGADEKRRVVSNGSTLNLGKAPTMVLISESGLNKLIMRSDAVAAGPFQEWVTREVLPAIRRTGGYRLQGVAPEAVEEGTVAEITPHTRKHTARPSQAGCLYFLTSFPHAPLHAHVRARNPHIRNGIMPTPHRAPRGARRPRTSMNRQGALPSATTPPEPTHAVH